MRARSATVMLSLMCTASIVGCSLPVASTPSAKAPAAPSALAGTAEVATGQEPVNDVDVIAIVNGQSISSAEYELRVAQALVALAKGTGLDVRSDEAKPRVDELGERVLDWMIDEALIEAAALEHHISVSDAEVDAQVDAMRGGDATRFNQWLASSGLTVEQVRAQIRADLLTARLRAEVVGDLPATARHVHVRHILVSEATAAEAALERIREGEDFCTVVQEVSEDEGTRDRCGDLGFLPEGVMGEAFDDVAFGLGEGQVSHVVRTPAGLHVINVLETQASREVDPRVRPALEQRAFEQWLESERQNADIVRSAPKSVANG